MSQSLLLQQDPPPDHVVRRQYKVWRAAAPFLYEVVLYQGLIWPSASVQFLRGSSSHQLLQCLIGAATSNADQPHLLLMEVQLPPVYSPTVRRDITGAHSSVTHTAGKIKTLSAWPSKSDIRRIRLVRGVARSLAACIGDEDPVISLYDIGALSSAQIPGRQSASVPPALRKCSRLVGLGGLNAEASALTCSTVQAGRVGAGCADYGVYAWDVQSCPDSMTGFVPPLQSFAGHNAIVTDLHYSPLLPSSMASASDDKTVILWDDRTGDARSCLQMPCAVSALEWSPFDSNMLASGGDDGVLYIWDVRRPDIPTLSLHDGTSSSSSVCCPFFLNEDFIVAALLSFVLGCSRPPFYMTRIAWAPFKRDVVAASGTNRRIMIWDLARQGMSQTIEEAVEGPPELAFVHGGHTATINDFDWSVDSPWTVASVSENNILEIWAISKTLRTPRES